LSVFLCFLLEADWQHPAQRRPIRFRYKLPVGKAP